MGRSLGPQRFGGCAQVGLTPRCLLCKHKIKILRANVKTKNDLNPHYTFTIPLIPPFLLLLRYSKTSPFPFSGHVSRDFHSHLVLIILQTNALHPVQALDTRPSHSPFLPNICPPPVFSATTQKAHTFTFHHSGKDVGFS